MATKAELIDAVAASAGVSKADAERTIGAFFDHVTTATKKEKGRVAGLRFVQPDQACRPHRPQPADRRAGEDRRLDGDEVHAERHAQDDAQPEKEEVTMVAEEGSGQEGRGEEGSGQEGAPPRKAPAKKARGQEGAGQEGRRPRRRRPRRRRPRRLRPRRRPPRRPRPRRLRPRRPPAKKAPAKKAAAKKAPAKKAPAKRAPAKRVAKKA